VKRVSPPPVAPLQASAKEIRDYWRSRIVHTIQMQASAYQLLEPCERDIRKLPPHVFELVIHQAEQLLDWACQTEPASGRTRAMEQHVNDELAKAIKQFRPAPPGLKGAQAQLQFETGSTP
jgi:hypothetical protein